MTNQLLLTRQVAASRLGISLRHLDDVWRDHGLPRVKLGRRAVRIPAEAVEHLAREGVPRAAAARPAARKERTQ
jgi:excisionase family DNA binding protein